MKIDVAETEIMKWIFSITEDFIAAAGVIQADVTETKTFSRKVFDWEVGRRERLKRTKTISIWFDEKEFIKNETCMGTKKDKHINTAFRCISRGPIVAICE